MTNDEEGRILSFVLRHSSLPPLAVWGDLAGRNGPDCGVSQTVTISGSKVFS